MTTLPQTLSERPRPMQSANGVPAVASPALPYFPSSQPGGPAAMNGADIWRVLRQNMGFLLIAVIIAGVAGYGLNEWLKRHYTTYTAEAQVMVQSPRLFDPTGSINAINESREVEMEMLLQNQAQLLKSPMLFMDIITDPNSDTRQSPWLISEASLNGNFQSDRAIEVLRNSFGARPLDNSSFIYLTMSAGTPQEAQLMLEEIVHRRMSQLSETNRQSRGGDLQTMMDMASQVRGEIKTLTESIQSQAQSTTAGDESAPSIVQQISIMNIERQQAQTQLTAIQNQLDAAKDAIERGVDPAGVEAMVHDDPLVMNYLQLKDQYDTQLELARSSYGEESSTYKKLQLIHDSWAKKLQDRESEVGARARMQVVSSLESAATNAQDMVNNTTIEVERLNEQLRKINAESVSLELKQSNLADMQTRLNNLQQQIDSFDFAANEHPGEELEWAARPILPPTPSFPRLPLTVGTCVIVGLMLATGLAFLREVLDSSVKSPRDIARLGNINILGIIPDDSEDPQAGDPLELSIANAPHSMTAEQFRLVRSHLGHVASLETTRTILVTSPSPGDGKTTIACNLAAGMALNGRRVLLVDANFRKPGLHKVFNLSNDHGLADALVDVGTFDDYTTETSVPNLSVLPAGLRPGNPTELIEGPAFTDLVDRALEEFDHVIFDSGPILFVSETGALAPQCDGVVSVVRAKRSTRGLVGRMRDSLQSLNVEHLGIVLNGMKHHAGGYYNRNIKMFYAYQNKNDRA